MAEVLVNRTTGHVVDGHLRIELALARKEPTVPVTYLELSDAEEQLVLATLNPLAAMATAEKDALAALLAGLSPADEGLAALLAELAEEHGIAKPLLGDPDEVPPVPDEADVYVKAGDLSRLGEHRLLCGDATDPAAVARLLAGATPTLLATDPPYGVRRGRCAGPARRHLEVAERSTRRWVGDSRPAAVIEARAWVTAAEGNRTRAAELFAEAARRFEAARQPRDVARCREAVMAWA